jgi:oligopeptide transport system ATP-binding protein
MSATFLELQDVQTYFPVGTGSFFKREAALVRAVDGVRLSVEKGEVLGLVGESGCGKSTLGRTILQLVPPTAGTVVLEGRRLNHLSGRELRRARADFQMIFQDPYASLNPRMTVFETLAEAIRAHKSVSGEKLQARISALVSQVGLLPQSLKKYPHEFSGGQRQRIAIARALAVEPKLIIADEPVSALDISIQAQIINLLAQLRREMELTIIFISHDLSAVKHISDRIAVMYLGKIVELGSPDQVLSDPLHPYTRTLISAVPIPDPARERQRKRLVLSGDLPSPLNPPVGCRFHPRCPYCIEQCKAGVPPLVDWGKNHFAACIRIAEIQQVAAVHPNRLGG